MYVIRVPEKEYKEGGAEKILKVMAENFLNLAKHINLHTEQAEQTPNRIYTKKCSPTLTVKLL